MTNITAPAGRFAVACRATATALRVPAFRAAAAINFPSIGLRSSAGQALVAVRETAVIKVEQARMMAAARGRIFNPRVRAWTYTLDGHDFYVLRLGDSVTLLYDIASEQWVEWTSGGQGVWRPNIGTTWIGAESLAFKYGSNIVIGDDTFGLLWFLDPDAAFDEHPDYLNGIQQLDFPRIATGQVLAGGRKNLPCYAIFVDGDNYGLTATDFVPSILLETSDDQGRSWVAHDSLTVVPDYSQDNPYSWYSLGQISSPGRIFRLTDNGVFARIDTMEMNDDG